MPKITKLLALLFVTSFALSACGDGGGGGDNAATDSPVENAAPADDTTTAN